MVIKIVLQPTPKQECRGSFFKAYNLKAMIKLPSTESSFRPMKFISHSLCQSYILPLFPIAYMWLKDIMRMTLCIIWVQCSLKPFRIHFLLIIQIWRELFILVLALAPVLPSHNLPNTKASRPQRSFIHQECSRLFPACKTA